MTLYILKRVLRAVPIVIAVSIVVFSLLHVAPGGPTGVMSGNPKVTEDDMARIREHYGLDKPLPLQYCYWFRQVFLRFDFGTSYVNGQPVSGMILERLPATLELMGTAFALAFCLCIVFGVLSAVNKNGFFDSILSIVSAVGMSVPVFWLGLMAIGVFSLKLGILPAGGRTSLVGSVDFVDHIRHLVLPATVLALAYFASWIRYLRTGLVEAGSREFIRTARAKGLGERIIVFKHTLRNAIIPLIAVISMQVPTLFTGAVLTETVFSWPGMGRLFYEGLQRYDYTRILGVVVISSLLIILFNLLGDLLCMIVDPRISPASFDGRMARGGMQKAASGT